MRPNTKARYHDQFVHHNDALPVTVEKPFCTSYPNMDEVLIELLEGDIRKRWTSASSCASSRENCPLDCPKAARCTLSFEFTEEGMITVRLVEPSHDVTVTLRHGGAEMSAEEMQALHGGELRRQSRADSGRSSAGAKNEAVQRLQTQVGSPMHEIFDSNKIPPKYWHDKAWLGLPEDVTHPTYFHILGLEPEDLDRIPIAAAGIDIEGRIRDQIKSNPAAGELTGAIMAAIAMARSTLEPSKPDKPNKRRAPYLEELAEAYLADVREKIREWEIGNPADLTAGAEVYEGLLELRRQFSLTQSQAAAKIELVKRELKPRHEAAVKDPAQPTHFDLLELPETITAAGGSLVRQSADRLISQWETKARGTNVAKLKSQYAAKAVEVREAARVLADTGLHRQYLGEIREKRERAFEALARQKIRPGTSEISRRVYQELMRSAQNSMRLAREHAEETLRRNHWTWEADKAGRLQLPQPVHLGSVKAGTERTFSFTLSNVGQQKVKVQIEPLQACITVKQRTYTIGVSETVTVSCQLAGKPAAGLALLADRYPRTWGRQTGRVRDGSGPAAETAPPGFADAGSASGESLGAQYAGTGQRRRRDVGLFAGRHRTVARAESEPRFSGARNRVRSRSHRGPAATCTGQLRRQGTGPLERWRRRRGGLGGSSGTSAGEVRAGSDERGPGPRGLPRRAEFRGECVERRRYAGRVDLRVFEKRPDTDRYGPGATWSWGVAQGAVHVPRSPVANGTRLSEQVQLEATPGEVAVSQINVQACVWVRPLWHIGLGLR